MYFSYNGTRNWLKIKWCYQSCMNLKVIAQNKHNKNSVMFWSSLLAFDLRETGMFEQACLVQIHFLLFIRDISPAS